MQYTLAQPTHNHRKALQKFSVFAYGTRLSVIKDPKMVRSFSKASPFAERMFSSDIGDLADLNLDELPISRAPSHNLPISGPQGAVKPFTVIRDPAAWTAKDWERGTESLIHTLSPEDVTAVKAALADFLKSGKVLANIRKPEDFPLPQHLTERLARIKHELLQGAGVAIIRGMPVGELTEAENVAAYMGLTAHIGQAGPQWKDGKLATHVTSKAAATSTDATGTQRGPEAFNRADDFGMHNDSWADVLSLLCIQKAKEGGVSAFTSALAVHNELLKRGQLMHVVTLAGAGFYRDKSRFQEVEPGQDPLWEMPVFSYHDGYLTTSYNANLNQQCVERYPTLAGKLSPMQKAAMAAFDEIANSDAMKLQLQLQPGDIALVNNINIMHARSKFVDGELPAEKRHLVRLWLCCKEANPLPQHLNFPRSYSINSYTPDMREMDNLMRPAPSGFYVPLVETIQEDSK